MEAVVPAPCWWTMMPRSVCTPSGIHSVYVTAIWSSPSAVDAGPDPDTPPIIPGPGSLPEGADAPPVLPGPGSLLELHPASTRLAMAATSASILPPASFIRMPAVQALPPRNRQGRTSWHPHRSEERQEGTAALDRLPARGDAEGLDRKSTRLNS